MGKKCTCGKALTPAEVVCREHRCKRCRTLWHMGMAVDSLVKAVLMCDESGIRDRLEATIADVVESHRLFKQWAEAMQKKS